MKKIRLTVLSPLENVSNRGERKRHWLQGMQWAYFNFDPAKERKNWQEGEVNSAASYLHLYIFTFTHFSSFLFSFLWTFISYFKCPKPFSQRKDKLDVNHSIICYGGVPESAMESHCTITHGLSDPTWEWCVLPRESWAGSSTGK